MCANVMDGFMQVVLKWLFLLIVYLGHYGKNYILQKIKQPSADYTG